MHGEEQRSRSAHNTSQRTSTQKIFDGLKQNYTNCNRARTLCKLSAMRERQCGALKRQAKRRGHYTPSEAAMSAHFVPGANGDVKNLPLDLKRESLNLLTELMFLVA